MIDLSLWSSGKTGVESSYAGRVCEWLCHVYSQHYTIHIICRANAKTLLTLRPSDKHLRCLFNISKQTWSLASPSIPQSLSVWLAKPVLYPELSGFSLYNPDILVTRLFVYVLPPGFCTWFSSLLPFLLSLQGVGL